MCVPSNTNISTIVFEELNKYKHMEMEIENMWHLKSKTVHGAVLGLIKIGNDQQIGKIIGATSLQKIKKEL